MKHPWQVECDPVVRGGVTFAWHRCLDCLKMIRWEEDRCYVCHGSHMKKLARAAARFERSDNPEEFVEKVREVKARWGLDTHQLAEMFGCRTSAISNALRE